MMCSVKRLALTASGVALLSLVLAAAPANAQFGGMRFGNRIPGVGGTLNPYNYYDPYGYSRQAAFNIALYGRAMSQVPPYALGYNPYPQIVGNPFPFSPTPYAGGYSSVSASPGYGASPGYAGSPGLSPGASDLGYSNPWNPWNSWVDPTTGFLYGASSIISSTGRFEVNHQQANLMREQVRSAHIDNNRKAFDEFLYERANRPTWLDDVERQNKLNLRAALTNPSASEILSGITLNTLLDNLRQLQVKGADGPAVALSDDVLSKINVTAGSGANPGLLKNERLTWPLGLSGSEFDPDRKKVERNLAAAVGEVEHGNRIEAARLRDLNDAIDRMTDQLGEQIGEITPSQYIEGRNYLRLLSNAVRALSGPDAANYVNNKYSAKGKTVGDLVRNMAGLRFAPATPGDEQAYKALQEKLAAYYARASSSGGRGE
jgi:hypothetical protein